MGGVLTIVLCWRTFLHFRPTWPAFLPRNTGAGGGLLSVAGGHSNGFHGAVIISLLLAILSSTVPFVDSASFLVGSIRLCLHILNVVA